MTSPVLTPELVRARVQEIADMIKEEFMDEEAHEKEDALHCDVLRAIAQGAASDPEACAAEALRTHALQFNRWCA